MNPRSWTTKTRPMDLVDDTTIQGQETALYRHLSTGFTRYRQLSGTPSTASVYVFSSTGITVNCIPARAVPVHETITRRGIRIDGRPYLQSLHPTPNDNPTDRVIPYFLQSYGKDLAWAWDEVELPPDHPAFIASLSNGLGWLVSDGSYEKKLALEPHALFCGRKIKSC